MGEPVKHPLTGLSGWMERWKTDQMLRTVLRNTGYLFSAGTISAALTPIQGILAVLLLGAEGYGILGMVTSFASNINRLLSFRMGELVIKYVGLYLSEGRKDKAAAVLKLAGITEALTSVIAYLLLVFLAPYAARWIIKDESTTGLIIFFGAALLANLMTETATAILQIGNHYRVQALLNLIQSILTAGWILVAFILHGSLMSVLLAYLVGKLIFGIGMMAAAWKRTPLLLGNDWWKVPLSLLEKRKEMLHYAISTNLSGTVTMLVRDSEVLFVGFFFDKASAGYYKFALGLMSFILLPVAPFVNTTFPEISTLSARRMWKELRTLLRRTTLIAAGLTIVCSGLIIVTGPWLLGLVKGGELLPSYPAVVILLIGFGIANIFFWNRRLLLTLGIPNYPLVVMTIAGLIKILVIILLAPVSNYLMMAWVLSAYFVITIGITIWKGLKEIRRQELL